MTVENAVLDNQITPLKKPETNIAPANKNTNSGTGKLQKYTLMDMTSEQIERITNLSKMLGSSSQSKNGEIKHADFFLMILKGMELGFSPLAAVDNMSLLFGTPTIDGKGMLALVYGSGLLKKINFDSTDKYCTIKLERNDVEGSFEYTFTLADAQLLGLMNKSQYKKQAKTMFKWRAVANLMRQAFPDVLGGVYTAEEIAPGDVSVDEFGGMHVIEIEPIVKSAVKNEPPKQKLDNASSSKDQSPAPAPTTAGETILKAKAGEDKLRKWLTDHEMGKSDFPGLLKELGVKNKFGEVKETDETKFYQLLQDAHDRYVGIKPTEEAKPEPEKVVTGKFKASTFEYDGKAIFATNFDAKPPVVVKCFSRTKFAKMTGDDWANGYGIKTMKAGSMVSVDTLEIEYILKTTKTASKRQYGDMTKVTVLDPEDNPVEESEDGFDDFFPPEKSQS